MSTLFHVELQLQPKVTSDDEAVLAEGKRMFPSLAAVRSHIQRDIDEFIDIFTYIPLPSHASFKRIGKTHWKGNSTIGFDVELNAPVTKERLIDAFESLSLEDTVYEGQGPWVLTVKMPNKETLNNRGEPVWIPQYREYGVVGIKSIRVTTPRSRSKTPKKSNPKSKSPKPRRPRSKTPVRKSAPKAVRAKTLGKKSK